MCLKSTHLEINEVFHSCVRNKLNIANFIENDFWTSPPPGPLPINFVHASHMDKVGHVAAAPVLAADLGP